MGFSRASCLRGQKLPEHPSHHRHLSCEAHNEKARLAELIKFGTAFVENALCRHQADEEPNLPPQHPPAKHSTVYHEFSPVTGR